MWSDAELLTAVQQGSVVSWRHVNVHGEYDFSDETPVPWGCLPVSLGLPASVRTVLSFGPGLLLTSRGLCNFTYLCTVLP